MTEEVEVRTIETRILGRYLLRPPRSQGPSPLLVGFHGYGENAQHHLAELARVPGAEDWTLVSIQGLHRFYDRRSGSVVASWMTSQDREQMIAHNLAYVDAVVTAMVETGTTGAPLVYSGFSQGVAMAYRAAARGAHRPAAIIALAGDLPPELREDASITWPSVLIGRGAHDPLYSQAQMESDLAWLKARGRSPRSVVFPGGHHWHEHFRRAAGQVLAAARNELLCPPLSR